QQLLDYLIDWLVNHILQTDQEMVASLNIGDKQPRGDADSARAEQLLQVALKESEGRFRMLADGAPVMLWLSGESGERSFFNATWLQTTGQQPEHSLGNGWQVLIHADDLPEYLSEYESCHVQPRACSREFRLRVDGGHFLWVLEQKQPRFLDSGKFIGMIASCVDISAQKQAQELLQSINAELEQRVQESTRELLDYQGQLEHEKAEQQTLINRLNRTNSQLIQSEKMSAIGQLAAGVAHEINNPVGYVKSNVSSLGGYLKSFIQLLTAYEDMEDLLKSDTPRFQSLQQLKQQIDPAFLKEDIVDLLEETAEGLDRVKKIVQDLKDFSRSDDAEWQFADIHKGLDSTLNVAGNEIKYRAKVIKNYGKLPQVECLPNQLNQVFMNLLVNAAQAVTEKGEIRISTQEIDGMAEITITDNGSGMPDEVKDHIFEPFYTTKPVGTGTGLGLSVSYGIIQGHHGSLTVESDLGRGSCFKIQIPLIQEMPNN
ncbi:MAG: ATP-binding protein, partial [Motiliproteus sp.]